MGDNSLRVTVFRVFKDKAGQWRWRLVARNGKIIADSGEGYTRERDAMRAAQRVATMIQTEAVAIENAEGIGKVWCVPGKEQP